MLEQTPHSQPIATAPAPEEQSFDWMAFAYKVLSHWVWIVLSLAIALCVAVVMNMRTVPTYTRTCMVLMKDDSQSGKPSVGSIGGTRIKSFGAEQTNIANEIEMMRSIDVMTEVVKRLNLSLRMTRKDGLRSLPVYENAPVAISFPGVADETAFSFKMKIGENRTVVLSDFVGPDGTRLEQQLKARVGGMVKTPFGSMQIRPTAAWDAVPQGLEILVAKLPVSSLAKAYSGSIQIGPSNKESSMITLAMTDQSRRRADDILNATLQVYNEFWIKDKNEVAESTNAFIEERLASLAKELGDVEQRITDYQRDNLIMDPEAASQQYFGQTMTNQSRIFEISNQLSMARYIRNYLSDRSKQESYLPANVGIGSTGVEGQISAYNTQLGELFNLRSNSSSSTPYVKKVEGDLAALRQTLIISLDNLIAQYQKQLGSWEQNDARTKQKLAQAPAQVRHLLSIGRQQKVKESLYIYLLQKREENELSKSNHVGALRIVQPPMAGANGSANRKQMVFLVALVVGLALPIGILYLLEMTNKTLRGREDLDGMKTPLIGEIPILHPKKNWLGRRQKEIGRQIYVKENSRDMINESFRILRTKLDYFMRSYGEDKKVIMLTSFNPGSGKSFVSMNLAKVLALKGKRVLALDMDLRHCSLSSLCANSKTGVTSYLSRMTDDLDSVIIRNAAGEGFDLLPVGIIPPNPTELLLGDRLATLFTELRKDYDYIVCDCPPIDIIADAGIVKEQCDVSLFVIRVGLMDRRALRDVDRLYIEKQYPRMGLLLNGADYVTTGYGRYKYGYSYGYSYGSKD